MTRALLPEGIPAWQMPFWDALKQHTVVVQRCDSCHAYRYVPKEVCPHCWSAESTWSQVSGEGEIYTYTVVHRGPTPEFQAEAPYAIAYVEMAEGFRMIGRVVDIPPAEVRIGMPVSASFQPLDEGWTALAFAPR